ncbi:MAG: phage tail protein [Anaerolineae bacterium]|nr:phage tail protein [Anaerolineae bacterium]
MENPGAPLPQYPQQPGQAQPYYPQQPQQPEQGFTPPAAQHAPSHVMVSPQAQNPAQFGIRAVDSLTANEFHVQINGQVATGIFAVTGLSSFKLKLDENSKPVGFDYPPLVITKMVQQDPNLPFNQWVREAIQQRGAVLPTREITIVAMDEGAETRRWVFRNAWISSVTFSDFDTAVEYLVEEKITIQHGGVEEQWPNR